MVSPIHWNTIANVMQKEYNDCLSIEMTKTNEMPLSVNENGYSVNKNGMKRMSKPLIERRSRARINTCLMQLKEMVIDSGEQSSQVSNYHLKTVTFSYK